jgi:hypothetical protein
MNSETHAGELKNKLFEQKMPTITIDSPSNSSGSEGRLSLDSLEEISENKPPQLRKQDTLPLPKLSPLKSSLGSIDSSLSNSRASSSKLSMTNSKAENKNLENLVPATQILFHNDRDFTDMKHFSNNMLLSFRDNLLFLFNTKTNEKQSIRVPHLIGIKEIHFYTYSDRISYIELTDSKFCNLYSLKITSGIILEMDIKKSCFFHPKLLIFSRSTKIYQVSEDHYYDMVQQKYIKPDFKNEINEMIESKVASREELEQRLQKIVALGFKFSDYFGLNSGLLSIYNKFGDTVLTDGYKFKYGIDAN